MQKTLKSADYQRLVDLLVAARHRAGLSQHQVAKALSRPQSFIAKYEGGERRIDVVEFVTIARALGADPIKLFSGFVGGEKPAPIKAPRGSSKLRKSRLS